MYWYEEDIERLEKYGKETGHNAETIFYGSSSIRLWTSLYDDFKNLKPANLGFGGSTLAACVWFFERVMMSYHPKRLVIYAGDNDLGDGRHPEEVFIFFQQLVVKTNERFGDLPCHFISLKPSISRWHMANQFKFTNNLIETEINSYNSNWQFIDIFKEMIDTAGHPKHEYYLDDGLHLSENGYKLWKRLIGERINH